MLPEEKSYNTRVKIYRDGTQQFSRAPFDKARDPIKYKRLPKMKESSEEKKKSNRNQSKERLFDLCRENNFKYFLTITFDPKIINSFDYDICLLELGKYCKKLGKADISYLFVAEQHKSGRIHFHGCVSDLLRPFPAGGPDGKQLFDEKGRIIYNELGWSDGFTTATCIDSPECVSTYISKYISKASEWLPKGKRSYICSKGLARPQTDHIYMYDRDVTETLRDGCHYIKGMQSPIGQYFLFERGGQRGADGEVNKMKIEGITQLDEVQPVGWVELPDPPEA